MAPEVSSSSRKLVQRRLFTKEGYDMRVAHPPVFRDARILKDDGSVKFEQLNVEVPEFWSDTSLAIVAQKYFYGEPGTPERENSIYDTVDRVACTNAAWMGFRCSEQDWPGILEKDPDVQGLQEDWDLVTIPRPSEEDEAVSITDDTLFRLDSSGRWHIDGQAVSFEADVLVHARPADTRLKMHEVYFQSYEEWRIYLDELKEILITQRASFNSPVWFNVGTRGPKGDNQQCSACFINRVEDTLSGGNGILDLYVTEGELFKNGSGSGTEVGRLRSKYEPVTGGGRASGPLSFMKGWDSNGGVIKSGGKTRRAAIMRTMMVDHPEVDDFIDCKAHEEKKARALGAAGYGTGLDSESYATVAYQNANLSVRVTDPFMHLVETGGEWPLRSRTMLGASKDALTAPNGLGDPSYVVRTIDAPDLFRSMAQRCWESGDPGIQFHDTINEWHTCAADGQIHSSNPCSEYLFLDDTACNLASMNLLRFWNVAGNYDFDVGGFAYAVKIITLAMEGWVSNASYPTPHIADMSHDYRTLGLGYGNLGALLMSMGIPYDSDEARCLASAITSLMCSATYLQSGVLAEIMGPFPAWEENKKTMRSVLAKHQEAHRDLSAQGPASISLFGRLKTIIDLGTELWQIVVNQDSHRNAQGTVIAPTGTIGIAMDFSTTGIEPELGHLIFKKLVGGGELRMPSKCVSAALNTLGYSTKTIEIIKQKIGDKQLLENLEEIKPQHLPVFDTSFPAQGGTRSIHWLGHVKMLAAVQPFISGSISKTINMPENSTVDDIESAMLTGWKMGLKCMALYRDNCKMFQPVSTKSGESLEEQTRSVPHNLELTPEFEEAYVQPVRRAPPRRRPAEVVKFRVGGTKGYLIPGKDPETGDLIECFINLEQGTAVDGWAKAFCILFSIATQYGVPLEALIRNIKDMEFEPSGFTDDTQIRRARSIPGYIVRRLGLDFLPREKQIELRLTTADDLDGTPLEEAEEASGEAITPEPPSVPSSPSGRVCEECGSFDVHFVGAGNCLQCRRCFWSEGGCAG